MVSPIRISNCSGCVYVIISALKLPGVVDLRMLARPFSAPERICDPHGDGTWAFETIKGDRELLE